MNLHFNILWHCLNSFPWPKIMLLTIVYAHEVHPAPNKRHLVSWYFFVPNFKAASSLPFTLHSGSNPAVRQCTKLLKSWLPAWAHYMFRKSSTTLLSFTCPLQAVPVSRMLLHNCWLSYYFSCKRKGKKKKTILREELMQGDAEYFGGWSVGGCHTFYKHTHLYWLYILGKVIFSLISSKIQAQTHVI